MRLVSVLIFSIVFASLCYAETVPELYGQSYSQEYAGRYDQALESMYLIKNQSDDYMCQLRIGWLLYLSMRYDESVDAYSSAAKFQPDSVEPYIGLIMPLTVQKKWRSVLVAVDNIFKNDPGNYSALGSKAWSLYSLGRYSESASTYKNIIKLYPADIDMQAGLGWALVQDGNKLDAITIFEEILRVSPSNISAIDGLVACQ
jgi:tetratricopeptide (TPR) repeat protein